MITTEELKTHFGKGASMDHAINLRDRLECNKNHLQPSLKWAEIEIERCNFLLPFILRDKTTGDSDLEFFKRKIEILEELIK